MNDTLTWLLRPGHAAAQEIRRDLWMLLLLAVTLIAAGLGLRDPWPADEPRFALIARDMLTTGDWLIPQVGADIYADKPPLFFWMIALATLLTQSLRVGFLLPSLLAGLGCVVLIYDLARRLWNRETGLLAGLALLFTYQFLWQARQAQIDAVLCFWTTLGLYGLLRHCLLGPAWRWYVIGWAAAALGIITKGVGFLPLLVLIPYACMRDAAWHPRPTIGNGGRWLLGPLALLAVVAVWLVPMLLAARMSPELAAYRDEILFGQTVDRYANAAHHLQPFWYFLVKVIPVLWLPLTALIPWLWTRWREDIRERDLRVVLPLVWTMMVVIFFSFSSGKRGVYILPALPAFVLASAPGLAAVLRRAAVRTTLFTIACAIPSVALLGAAYLFLDAAQRIKVINAYDIDPVPPLLAMGVLCVLICAWARRERATLAYCGITAVSFFVMSFWVNPAINDVRSGARLIRKVEALTKDVELGVAGYREQYLLCMSRPAVNFGHARWREADQEAADAALWLISRPGRVLFVDDYMRQTCFANATAQQVDRANRRLWWLVSGTANPDCVARGRADMARIYDGRQRNGMAVLY